MVLLKLDECLSNHQLRTMEPLYLAKEKEEREGKEEKEEEERKEGEGRCVPGVLSSGD